MLFFIEKCFLHVYMYIFKIVTRLLPFKWPLRFTGPGSSQQLLQHIAQQNHQHLLIVTDATLVKLGLIQPLYDQATALNIKHTTYSGILPDPTLEQIELGYALLNQVGADAILAIGGGSVIDGAKMIGALAKNNKPLANMTGLFKVRKGILPLYVVPTTAGTGSEATIAAVVSDPVAKRKLAVLDPKLMPTALALDAQIMQGLPPAITAATGIDALTHAIESYLSRNATTHTNECALECARLVFQHLPTAYHQGNNLEARQHMAQASMLGGMAFTQAGVGYIHAIAHNLGALYHVPHGLANAMVMPYVLTFSLAGSARAKQRMAQLARHCGISSDSNDQAAAEALIAKIEALNEEFGIPKHPPELQAADIPYIAKAARSEARFTYAVPRYMNQAMAEQLLTEMLGPKHLNEKH
ncbi:iron-containing alcohol dehydrogenase [Aliidiomarina quisquiliarum]|uniref:iron-containing alcohol dehydrogenase n=1 Tax=Aliidiomarina quisquiliarum TaxID=2938947 RepID=UPI00208F0B99|nr:iron-containing alcohol dehydrogenase [Aliidiomarina quisquiliarum]MCO4320322.1 iron-containing alcohol dehydrogenase [Aliidiomarina quisquiliarum]